VLRSGQGRKHFEFLTNQLASPNLLTGKGLFVDLTARQLVANKATTTFISLNYNFDEQLELE
jgi:hypothetical protein